MKIPRISLQSAMAFVIVAAIDCMTLRVIEIAPKPMTGLPTVIALGSLPIANLMVIGLSLKVASKGRWKAFWMGFNITGSVALVGFLGYTIVKPNADELFINRLEPLFD